jgi:hypothetical protein
MSFSSCYHCEQVGSILGAPDLVSVCVVPLFSRVSRLFSSSGLFCVFSFHAGFTTPRRRGRPVECKSSIRWVLVSCFELFQYYWYDMYSMMTGILSFV